MRRALVGLVFALLTGIGTLQAQSDVEITLYRADDSLTLYVPGNRIVSLQGLLFETEDATHSRYEGALELYPSFGSLNFGQLQAPLCFQLRWDNSRGTMPITCQALSDEQIFQQDLSDADVFWHDEMRNQDFTILISNGFNTVSECSATAPQCSIRYSAPADALPVTMALVPAGTYTVGSGEISPTELTRQQVTLAEFAIDRTEVTNGDYQAFIDAGGYTDPAWWSDEGWGWVSQQTTLPVSTENQPDYPRLANWYEADAYCRWREARLPDEREWEAAAGWSGTEIPRAYPWGIQPPDDSRLNFNHSADAIAAGTGTRPVASYPPSALGLYDMAGNVREWTADHYDEHSYVIRGGSYRSSPEVVRVTAREHAVPDFALNSDIGFRCALSLLSGSD